MNWTTVTPDLILADMHALMPAAGAPSHIVMPWRGYRRWRKMLRALNPLPPKRRAAGRRLHKRRLGARHRA